MKKLYIAATTKCIHLEKPSLKIHQNKEKKKLRPEHTTTSLKVPNCIWNMSSGRLSYSSNEGSI